ncbi:putative leucine-rich repeat-containing protein DDB_G0290503 isoform X2 [Zeugodacus cucurbitae]|uniref:putative leucine-rich repeat-containing protein DDB_G0290503 isoform X2 n=1 Tax=Zeugodacus cucurbitae TaxID=28588 RepID=UPI0023D94306|nr:putative leucine-rich repeat-containing protein DDB_G0290503 isoform X2 [Zeugodacus cucurbitae]
MADKHIKTTSSSVLDEKNDRKQATNTLATSQLPGDVACGSAHPRNVQILTKLANTLSESSQLVKQRQQKYKELSSKLGGADAPQLIGYTQDCDDGSAGEWQEVKNKLKRKKKLSTSLTSVSDSVNQEKRTRIEGIQLNCRGKLHITELPTSVPQSATRSYVSAGVAQRAERWGGAKSSPTTTNSSTHKQMNTNSAATTQAASPTTAVGATGISVPPPRLKRKLQENVQTIQKLNALTEQLRLEINELKSSLTTERGAVRVLRAQNESETRKWKNEVKRLQNSLEILKKNSTLPLIGAKKATDATNENIPNTSIAGNTTNYEVQRLTNEVIALKEANRALEEKKMLEEIKTKERNIGQLKKEIQTLQIRPQSQTEVKSRNATNNTQTTNKTTKPKRNNNNNKMKTKSIKNSLNETNASASALTKKSEDSKDTTRGEAQHPNEVKNLKDIELINNSNIFIQNNINSTTPTTDVTGDNSEAANANRILTHSQSNLKSQSLRNVSFNLNVNVDEEQIHNNINSTPSINSPTTTTTHNDNCNDLLKTTTTTTALATAICTPFAALQSLESAATEEDHIRQIEANTTNSATIDNMCTTTTVTSTTTQTANADERRHNDRMHDDRMKDNNSDSDSALSSAPPSISPQPPPAGLDTADIWQMIRTYSTDLQKLQKDNEILQKENEHLHAELNLAKEHILDAEKSSLEMNNNAALQQLMARIKQLEEQEHQLSTEADELREQNELLEFRIVELEETNDKWSLQSHATSPTTTDKSQTVTAPTATNIWTSGEDPMQMIFGKCGDGGANKTSGFASSHSQQLNEDEANLTDPANEEFRHRITQMLRKYSLDSDDKHCLQQLIQLVQHLDLMAQRSEPNSLNTASCSSDETSSLELVKSRISDYSSASSASSARSTHEVSCSSSSNSITKSATKPAVPATSPSNAARIVATVSPYNSSPQHQIAYNNNNSSCNQLVPTNTPTDSPRKSRQAWQSNSLSESGVFVESDFLSDVSENNVCTQTDFEDESAVTHAARDLCNELQKLQCTDSTRKSGVANLPARSPNTSQYSPNLSEQKQLQYYKERLALLESKVLIYESSGDLQNKRLADRLQREILLEKELKELRDRVEFLESENLTLEEEKCEFEEAENDTRLRLQRLEVELEILSQRNVELEMSREALSAKYKDCRSECLILREDLGVSETQIRHIEEDKQKAKENLEILHNLLPLIVAYYTTVAYSHWTNNSTNENPYPTDTSNKTYSIEFCETLENKMGNVMPMVTDRVNDVLPAFSGNHFDRASPIANFNCENQFYRNETPEVPNCVCQYLKEEVKCLRNQIKDLNSRHYEAMESADTHWVELERQYKDREEAYRAKECCLKAKIQKLQDCLRDDARAANEKICQLEEAESDLKNCLVRVSKEHRDLLDDNEFMRCEYERLKEQLDALKAQQKPTLDQLEQEKKRNKTLNDEVNFMRKLQAETECRNLAEMESLQGQLFELKKEFLHIEVTNSELKEEVATLEQQVIKLQHSEKDLEDKTRVLQDEVKSKEEMVQKLEKRLERSEGYSLAQELSGSPSKRFKREDVKDLKTASTGLGNALRNFKECETSLPSHQQFSSVARDVKRLADSLLHGDSPDDEVSITIENIKEKPQESESTKIQLSADDVIAEENLEIPEINIEPEADENSKEPSHGQDLTIAMALMPQFVIDECLMPIFMTPKEKQICAKQISEVPSELRMLSDGGRQTAKVSETFKRLSLVTSQRNRKRRIKRRVLQTRVRRIVSCFNSRRPTRFHDVIDIDISQSEVLQRFDSFHSLREDAAESHHKIDAFTETNFDKFDKETETEGIYIESKESSVQVNDDMNPERMLDCVPSQARMFINLLKSSVIHDAVEVSEFNKNLIKRWEADKEFRDGLEILQTYSVFDSNSNEQVSAENYEHFVNAMSCLHVLEELFKPTKVPIMQQIEDQINEQLMNFHTKRMESEFYCTVYYPVKREINSESTNDYELF